MTWNSAHDEPHLSSRSGWLRAAVMGANDGVLSVSALVVGVAAAGADRVDLLLAGLAGSVAGAMSMAAGEYVSVSSQADVEAADVAKEREELARNPDGELAELVAIYRARGLSEDLAQKVAWELTARDALGAHLRDEIGITDLSPPRPVQAALVSAVSFAVGAAMPMLAAVLRAKRRRAERCRLRHAAGACGPRRAWCAGRRGAHGPCGGSGRDLGRVRHGRDRPDRRLGRATRLGGKRGVRSSSSPFGAAHRTALPRVPGSCVGRGLERPQPPLRCATAIPGAETRGPAATGPTSAPFTGAARRGDPPPGSEHDGPPFSARIVVRPGPCAPQPRHRQG